MIDDIKIFITSLCIVILISPFIFGYWIFEPTDLFIITCCVLWVSIVIFKDLHKLLIKAIKFITKK